MRLLITRPLEDSERLASRLRALGHEPIVAPLLTVHHFDEPPVPLAGVQAILATSANGVRALARLNAQRDVALYAVGPQTADVARALGYVRVVSADGDAAALAETVAAALDPAAGALFHAAGAETAGRLRQRLEARGFTVETQTLYAAEPVDALPQAAAAALAADTLDGMLVFSPRSAKTLANLVASAGLAAKCARLVAYAISAAAAEALAPLAFARVAVAGAPNEDAMLDLLAAAGPVASPAPSPL